MGQRERRRYAVTESASAIARPTMMVGRNLVYILGVAGLEVLRRPKRIGNLCNVGIADIELSALLCGVRKPGGDVADDTVLRQLTPFNRVMSGLATTQTEHRIRSSNSETQERL